MSSRGGGDSLPHRRTNPPTPGIIPIHNNDDGDDNDADYADEEEEMISLGLQRDLNSIMKSPSPSPASMLGGRVGAGVGTDQVEAAYVSEATSSSANIMIGANRKSAYPVTPAAIDGGRRNSSSRNYSSYNNNNAMRRTPGPPPRNDDPQHHSLQQRPQQQKLKQRHSTTTNYHHPTETPQKLHSSSSNDDNLCTPQLNVRNSNNSNKNRSSLNNIRNSSNGTNFNSSTPSALAAVAVVLPTATTTVAANTGRGGDGRQLYTPAHFTLSKNPDLHLDTGRLDALSPNTLRMTNSLENILNDDDDVVDNGDKAGDASENDKGLQQPQLLSKQQQQRMRIRRSCTPITTNKSTVSSSNVIDEKLLQEKEDDDSHQNETSFRRIHSQRRRHSSSSSDSEYDSDDEELEELEQLQFSDRHHVDDDDSNDDDDDVDEELDDLSDDEDALNYASGDASTTIASLSGGVVSVSGMGVIQSPQKHNNKERQRTPIRPTPKHSRQQRGSSSQQHAQYQRHSPPNQHQQQRGRQQHPQQRQQQQYPCLRQYPHHQQQYQPGYFSPVHHPHHPPPPHHHGSNYQYSPYGAGVGSLHRVSPLTLPSDYGHYYPSNNFVMPHLYGGSMQHSSNSPSAAAISHGSWSPIPEFNPNQPEWHPTGSQQMAAASSWGHPLPPHHHQRQGMEGIHPGHVSPLDFGFHAIPGHASPEFFLHGGGAGGRGNVSTFVANVDYPPAPPHPHHPHQHHHGSYAPPQPQQHFEYSEQQDQHHPIQSSHPASPIKTSGSPDERHRNDAGCSVGSAFIGSATVAAATTSPTSSHRSVLKQTHSGGFHVTPSDVDAPSHHHGWYISNNNQIKKVYSPGRSMAPLPPSSCQARYDHISPQNQQGRGGVGLRGEKSNNGHDVESPGLFESASSSPSRISSITAAMMGDRKLSNNELSPSLGFSQDVRNHPISSGAIALEARINRNSARSSSKAATLGGGNCSSGVDDEKLFIMESPTARQAFKEFARNFRQREAESLSAARDFALASLSKDSHGIYLPPATHWRVYLELADLAKRSNEIDASRQYYRKACQVQPNASQCWLEYSKLEEESGNLKRCADILQEGLKHCSTNENLLVRALKFYERVGHRDHARHLLARLKDSSIEKSWKTILEGAQMEARAGRYFIAREWLKYLTHHVPWYGPLYKIHSEFERDYGDPADAFAIVERGLKELPRYGPLYLVAFRLLEKDDLLQKAYDLPKTMDMVSRADNISRELLWRVHFEAAQSQERAAMLLMVEKPKLSLKKALYATRRSYSKAIMLSPPNLVWKIWLASGRTEVSCGNTNGARDLFLRAYDCVTEKGRSTVLLECARLEEFCGDLVLSRSILCKARNEHGKSDWKVWLSSVNLECRCGLRERAIVFAQNALSIHRGTGRLWAALIQLRHEDGEMSQMRVLKLALKSVPKSGEVWCEGARISLNPFCPTFDLQAASRHLAFAARFTPQYGDSFLEQLRLDMIEKWLLPLAEPLINEMYNTFLDSNKMGHEGSYQFITECTIKAADTIKAQLKQNPNSIANDVVNTSKLELHCYSANPNYGHLWFQCRNSPIDTAKEVIAQAKDVMASDIINKSYIYVAAMVRRAGIMMVMYHSEIIDNNGTAKPAFNVLDDRLVDQHLRSAPTLGVMLSEKDATGSMFVTGLMESNKSWDAYSLAEKRRILFGSDSLVN